MDESEAFSTLINRLPASYRNKILSPFSDLIKMNPPPLTVMDFAAGQSETSDYFEKLGFNTVKVDASAMNLLIGKGNKVVAKAYETTNLPFADKSFDAIHMKDSMTHIDNPYYLLDEFARVLKPDGLLLIADVNRRHIPYIRYEQTLPLGLKIARRDYFGLPPKYQKHATALLHNSHIPPDSISQPYYPVLKDILLEFAQYAKLRQVKQESWKPSKSEGEWYVNRQNRFILTFRKS